MRYKIALKGRSITAQGNALGKVLPQYINLALKGRHECGFPCPYRAAIFWGGTISQGGEYALPWAVMHRPYRPKNEAQPHNKHSALCALNFAL